MDDRRKRLLYRATHRGTREADRLVGGFAQVHLNGSDVDPGFLDAFETVLDENDVDLVNWIIGRTEPVPERHSAILKLMIDFQKNL